VELYRSRTKSREALLEATLEAAVMSKFKVGEMVTYKPDSLDSRIAARGAYEVMAIVPSEGGTGASYRIKSMSEDHQRVADETELARM
jgi:hypothetical protein